jgi:hypothetical protein
MKLLEDEFKGKTVTLKQPLYTILSADSTGRTSSNVPTGINVVSPDKGMYFRFVEVGGASGLIDISDSDATRLKDRVVAAKPRRPGAPPPQLLTYGPGTKMIVRVFDWGVGASRIVSVALDDEFANPGALGSTTNKPSTSLSVLWPTPFSAEFEEGAKVRELLLQVFDVPKQ